jgi:heavy metal translocating P-type ATPase
LGENHEKGCGFGLHQLLNRFNPEKPEFMDFEIRHFIPGRVRLRVPVLNGGDEHSGLITQALEAQPGVTSVRVNAACASVVIEFDRAQPEVWVTLRDKLRLVTPAMLPLLLQFFAKQPLAPLGKPAKGGEVIQTLSGRYPLVGPTISLALAFAAPIMAIVNIPLMLWNSIPIAKRAWRVLSRERRLNVDFLDVLAISVSIGQANYVTAVIVIWLIRLGDWIRDLTAARSKRAVAELLEFQTRTAWLVRGDVVVSVPTSQLAEGDRVLVHSGEMIPVDGEVVAGQASVDQKTITGESLPVTRGVGENVYAATILREGQITICASRVGQETAAAQIVRLIDSAPVGETRMQNHAERFADRLVLPTLGLATTMAAVTADINRFLSLVIVDYGTGIRVSAPTAMLASMTAAARKGILFKTGAHVEKLAEVDTIVFDKTGTLTRGTPQLLEIKSYDERCFKPWELLALAAAAEARLQHPVAQAVRLAAQQAGIEVPECHEVQYRVGMGVEAKINGYFLHLGSPRFLRHCNICLDCAESDLRHMDEAGQAQLILAIDGQVQGLMPYADQVRPESREVIGALHKAGIRDTIMLTGDNAAVARAVGRQLGIDRQFAGTLPADKAEVIQQLRREGRVVAMVGDGINDSPALAFADIGVAMKHGAEVAHESAQVVLMEDSLWKLVDAIRLSKDAVGLIKQNYAIVAGMNTIALVLALPGNLISPQLTAVISNGSAIVASLNGIRPILNLPRTSGRDARPDLSGQRQQQQREGRRGDEANDGSLEGVTGDTAHRGATHVAY